MTPKLLEGSPEAKVIPVGCAVGSPITSQLNLEAIPILGLVDTGASVTCMGFSLWWQYRTQWGPLKPFEGIVHGAHGKPLQIAGKTQHLNLQWDEARGRASFIVIIGLESPPVLIGMDIMRPLRIHIDVTRGTATPAQPDPQTTHLNAGQAAVPPPPPPAALYCYKPSKSQQKQRDWFTATTLGPVKTCISALRKACPHLSPECLPSPVDPRFGSPSTIIDPNLSSYTLGKP